MPEEDSQPDMQQAAVAPRLVVELPSRPRVFFRNLFDLLIPRRLPALKLLSAPAPFWPDVFVNRRLPWGCFLQSCACHVMAFGLLVGFTRFLALQPRALETPVLSHPDVIDYQPDEYLPPLDTREATAARPQKANPEVAVQPIIAVPADADNREQTIVTPPNVRLKQPVALPNMVAWSGEIPKPQLAIPPVPLTPAAEIARMAPAMENSVVIPPPDAAHFAERRESLTLENSVVAPPPDLPASKAAVFWALQPAVVAPPPSVERLVTRQGDGNVGRSSVIAPAPQLPIAIERAVPAGRSSGHAIIAPQVVAPPPSVAASGSSFGSRSRVIALNLHPDASAPPTPPAGNRRGSFAASPEGHFAASGAPGVASGNLAAPNSFGAKTNGKLGSELPSGLYVGTAVAKSSPLAGSSANKEPLTAATLASNSPPPRMNRPRTESAAQLSDAERNVFGGRKFYSLTLNMPNLNSAGGSWVIRFAEMYHQPSPRDASVPPDDLSQPAATRKVDPAYPIQLMRQNVSGTVILYAIIHADGTVGNVKVLHGVDDRIDQFASQAVAQWQFQPALKNGTPVDVEATFLIPFRPARWGSNF
jgi:TonB family protein